jgi:hypothetical protein
MLVECRIYYVRLGNAMNDLANLEIPINLLYERFKMRSARNMHQS